MNINTVRNLCKNSSDFFCEIFSEIGRERCTIRGIDTSVTDITDLGTLIICSLSIILTFVLAVKAFNKVSAVGRKEMFVLLVAVILNFVLIILNKSFGIESSTFNEWMHIIGIFTRVTTFWALLFFGFVGFQLIPDGSAMSLFLMVLSTILVGVASGYVTYLVETKTNKEKGAFGTNKAAAISLFVFAIILPLVSIIVYLLAQATIVFKYLAVRRPLLWLVLTLVFFAMTFVFNNFLSYAICNGADQAINGSMFSAFFQMLAAFSIYRFWYSITEDEIDDIDAMYKY